MSPRRSRGPSAARRAPPSRPPAPARGAGARDRLIEASSRVLREYGYRAAPLDEILARSGVAKSNLYYHFPGKLELACATVDEWLRKEVRALSECLSDERSSGLERIRTAFEAFAAGCHEGPCGCPFGMLGAEDDLEEPLRLRVETAFAVIVGNLESAVRVGQRDGSIRADLEAQELALTLLAALQGGGLLGRAGQDPGRVMRAAEPLLRAIASEPGEAVG